MSIKRRDGQDARTGDGDGLDIGLACRGCGCRHLDVYYTRRRDKYITRSRICRNCGKRLITREKGLGEA